MQAISYENLCYYTNYFNKLRKAGLDFEIQKNERFIPGVGSKQSYQQLSFFAKFKNVKSLTDLVTVWTASPAALGLDSIEDFTGYTAIKNSSCCTKVTGELYRKNNPAIRFYAAAAFDNNPRVNLFLLDKKVPEKAENGHSIRYCVNTGLYNAGSLVYCANEQSPSFNYIDEGHVVVYVSAGESLEDGNRMFVTDAVTLDMNYIIAAASIYPPAIDQVLQNKAFVPTKDCRLQLLKMEKVIPAKLRPDYMKLKQEIQDDFSKNTANVMVGKLTRKESPFIDLNGIRITSKRADYTAGRVSIEANNLANVVFAKLNPNEVDWDIFTLINIYTDYINDAFKNLPLNATQTGFTEAKSFTFKINDIPLTVSCSTENTRRAVNDHLINVDELSPVLKRASCYQVAEDATDEDNKKNFDRFIKNVSRHSLKIRDVWANGLPVKTVFLQSDSDNGRGPATIKHPKLRFVHKDEKANFKGFYLQVNQLDPKDKTKVVKTNEYRIGKFAEFVKKVEAANKDAYMGYHGNYVQNNQGFYIPRDGSTENNSCAVKICELLGTYADGITEDDKKAIVGIINFELGEAEKRSEEMLKEVCDLTKSKVGTREGKKGYIVPGKMRTYFVEEEGTMKVWNNDPHATDPYFCVVNRGEQGVGKDALVARILALHNDSMMVKQIHTLKRN